MYPVLILRCEAVCLVLLLCLIRTSKSYHMGRDSKTFYRLSWFAVIHVIFDIITVLTVNNLETVPHWLNYICHLIFYMSAIMFSHEILDYVVKCCYPLKSKAIYLAGFILPVIYVLLLPWLPIDYVTVHGTNSSTGPAAYAGYGIAFIYFIAAAVIIFINKKKLSLPIRRTLLPFLLVLLLTETVQCFYRELLFTGAACTIVTVAFFFTLENPIKFFEKKVMTDALTGVRSRHSYDQSIEAFDEEFRKHPNSDFIFVFCDINNLRAINARFGHAEGDHYISFISSILQRVLVNCEGIYRMGGDEFLVIYKGVDEEIVGKELAQVHATAEIESAEMSYDPSVAIGYAVSSSEYTSLRDVLRTADYIMYRNKAEMKGQKAFIKSIKGTRLNLSGLTDRVFDAMCSSNDRSYPFLTNMDTGVTRISDSWKDFFGLKDVFFADFNSLWMEYIHPDDRMEFFDDISDCLGGRSSYHNSEYRALAPNGEYVVCSCHGAIYHGKDGEPDIFAGYMFNHGVEDSVDAITGLYNYKVLSQRVLDAKTLGKTIIILKLRIRNFNRISMLYGDEESDEIRRQIAVTLTTVVGSEGAVYSPDGSNFSIKFDGNDRKKVREIYTTIRETFAAGIQFRDTSMPIDVYAGALEIRPKAKTTEREDRSNLIAALEESGNYRHGDLVFFDDLSVIRDGSDFNMLAAIHEDALGSKEYFSLRYQPIVAAFSGETMGAEALLRWSGPGYGEVGPDKFIAFLENDPCYYDLGFHIMRIAIRDAVEIQKRIPYFRMSVNMTALQLQHDDFLPRVLEILNEYDYPPENLVMELTERCKELDENFLKKRIAGLRSAGIKVALDDMGTGYSTVSLLVNIPMDEIKLDKEFTAKLLTSNEHRIIADALARGVTTGHVDLCFEGIETQEMLDYVKACGPFLCQGYFFARPLPIDKFLDYVSK